MTMYVRESRGDPGRRPARGVLTNADLEKMFDTTDAWIRGRTGIVRRHIAAAHETTVSIAEPAVRRALDAASVAPEEDRSHRVRHDDAGFGVPRIVPC